MIRVAVGAYSQDVRRPARFRGAKKSRIRLGCRYSLARWRYGSNQGFRYRKSCRRLDRRTFHALVLAGLVGCNQWDEVAERAVCNNAFPRNSTKAASLSRWPKSWHTMPAWQNVATPCGNDRNPSWGRVLSRRMKATCQLMRSQFEDSESSCPVPFALVWAWKASSSLWGRLRSRLNHP